MMHEVEEDIEQKGALEFYQEVANEVRWGRCYPAERDGAAGSVAGDQEEGTIERGVEEHI
jgi:hypothetical protein